MGAGRDGDSRRIAGVEGDAVRRGGIGGEGRGKVGTRVCGKLVGGWKGFGKGLGVLRARVKGGGNFYKSKGRTNRDIEKLFKKNRIFILIF